MSMNNTLHRLYQMAADKHLGVDPKTADKHKDHQRKMFQDKLRNILEASYKQDPNRPRAEIIEYDGESLSDH